MDPAAPPDPVALHTAVPGTVIEGGTLWILRMLDVADQVDLEAARALAAQTRDARRGALTLRGPEKGPGGVVLASQPLDLDAGEVVVDGMRLRAGVRLFDFGAVSVRFALELPPGTACTELLYTVARLEQVAALDTAARQVWARVERDLRPTLRGSHTSDLIEDYLLIEVRGVRGCTRAAEALRALEPARLMLAEPERPLSEEIVESHMRRAIQYYADDAAVIGWNAALVLDADGARDQLEVLEIATARLLELRYYDNLLARELAGVYTAAEVARGSSALFRSPFVRVARRAATLFVEMTDLYDRVEGALTLVGDAYTARLYREAAHRFRLTEISAAVREKLGTLAQVSEIFEAEINHRRATLLEIAIVLLIVLEVVLGLVRSRH